MLDGQPCARGGEPLYRWQLDLPRTDRRKIHADHVGVRVAHDETALPDALSCAYHNLQHGAREGNRERGRIKGEIERAARDSAFPRAYARDARNDGLPCW
jgi:hypothetical protein